MPGKWKRPDDVEYPSVWRRFKGRRAMANGHVPSFWIQDLPPDMFEHAITVMCSNFIYDEPLCKYSNLPADEPSVEEIKHTWRELVKDHLALVCMCEPREAGGEPVIAGINMTYLSEPDEKIPEFKAERWAKVVDTVMYLCEREDAYARLGITEYMGALGLSVLPEYRGQGIGLELLEARSDLCRAVGLKATLTVFTATASQKLAEKSGFRDIAAMSYEEIERLEPRFRYPGIQEHTTHVRYMYKMIE